MILKNIFYEKNGSNIFDCLLFLALIGAGIKYTFDIESFLDIQLYDESDYLYQGMHLATLGFSNSQWGPVYSLWYYILSVFGGDPVDIYFLNFRIITVIVPVLLYVLLRIYKVPRLPSFLTAYFVLISSGNFSTVPKVSHFAVSIILLSIIISSFRKNPHYRFLTLITGALISSYVRPEFFLSFVVFLSIYLYKIITERSFLKDPKPILILAGIAIIIVSVFGIPLANDTRSFLAFRQHFSLNWIKWNASPLSPWTDSREITYENFGNVESIYEAMITNSRMFSRHISENINSFIMEFSYLCKHPAVLFPDNYRFQKLELSLIIIILIFYILYNIFVQKEYTSRYLKRNLKHRAFLILSCFGYLIPVVISITLIYPRKHYLFMLLVIIVIMLMALLYPPLNDKSRKGILSCLSIVSVSVILVMLTPSSSSLPASPQSRENICVIKYLRSLNIKEKVNILEAGGGYNIYIGSNYERVAQYDKNCRFNEFLIQKNINMIILNADLISDSRFRSDSSWMDFLINHERFNFKRVKIPDTNTFMLVEDNLSN